MVYEIGHLIKYICVAFLLLRFCTKTLGCKTNEWYNMTMEQLLLKSDTVVYGKDVGHGKFRLPTMLDARFDIYCVIKTGDFLVPGQVIIENINARDECSGVTGQTTVGQVYILGLKREFSGFMSYASINPLQKTAFPATIENLNKLAASCGLDEWEAPKTGDQNRCPAPNKPRFCTKIRYPEDINASRDRCSVYQTILAVLTVCLFRFLK